MTTTTTTTHVDDALALLAYIQDGDDRTPTAIQDAVWRLIEELRRYDKGLPLGCPLAIGRRPRPPQLVERYSFSLSPVVSDPGKRA